MCVYVRWRSDQDGQVEALVWLRELAPCLVTIILQQLPLFHTWTHPSYTM